MKTEKEWLNIYHECCHLFGKNGQTGNRVRLTLGQFRDDDNWGFIEVIGFNSKFLARLIEICEKYVLGFDFSGRYEFKIREKQETLEDDLNPSQDAPEEVCKDCEHYDKCDFQQYDECNKFSKKSLCETNHSPQKSQQGRPLVTGQKGHLGSSVESVDTSKSKGCGKGVWWCGIKYKCGQFEDLKHSDHIILCDDCRKKSKSETSKESKIADEINKDYENEK